MPKPSRAHLIIKDLVDFVVIFSLSSLLTLGIYYLVPGFTQVKLSFYFLEQFLELFFANPVLFVCFLALGLVVSLIYYLCSSLIFQTSLGGRFTKLKLVDQNTKEPLSPRQSVLMAMGAFLGVTFFFIGPLKAFWLDDSGRGLGEKWAGITANEIKIP